MKVYIDNCGEKHLVGRADVPEDHMLIYEVPLFGTASVITERFTLCTMTHLPAGGGPPVVERVVLLVPGQLPELLPGWQSLAS